jgi:hypothetical protein
VTALSDQICPLHGLQADAEPLQATGVPTFEFLTHCIIRLLHRRYNGGSLDFSIDRIRPSTIWPWG